MSKDEESQILNSRPALLYQFYQFFAFWYPKICATITSAKARFVSAAMHFFFMWIYASITWGKKRSVSAAMWVMHQDVGNPPNPMPYASQKWLIAYLLLSYAGLCCLAFAEKAKAAITIHFPGIPESFIILIVLASEVFGAGIIFLCAWARHTRRERLKTIVKFLVMSCLAPLAFLLGDVSTGDWFFTGFAWCSCLAFMCLLIYFRSPEDVAIIDCITSINMGFSYVHKAKEDWHVWFFGIPIGLKALLEYFLDHDIL